MQNIVGVLFVLALMAFGIGSVWLSLNRTPRTGGFPLTRRIHK